MDTLPPATQGHNSNQWHCTKHISNHPQSHPPTLHIVNNFVQYRLTELRRAHNVFNLSFCSGFFVWMDPYFSFSALWSEGTLWSRKNIDYFTRRERMFTQRFCCRECKYKMEIRTGDWQMLGAVLTLGLRHWSGTSEEIWNPTLQQVHFWPTDLRTNLKKQHEDRQSLNVLTQGLRLGSHF